MDDYRRQRNRMVDRQIEARGIRDTRILDAFRAVPREMFVPADLAGLAYDDRPLPIGEEQSISQPFIVGSMIEAAKIGATDRILEVGAGSGYAAAVMSRIAGQVYAIERLDTLARAARERIEELGLDNCRIIAGDGAEGLPEKAPFNAILVAARVDRVPAALKRQLAIGGRLVIPVGGEGLQQLTCLIRVDEDRWESHAIAPVRFVPLLRGKVVAKGTRSSVDPNPADHPVCKRLSNRSDHR